MDKALVFGTKDCRFESCQGHAITDLKALSITLRKAVPLSTEPYMAALRFVARASAPCNDAKESQLLLSSERRERVSFESCVHKEVVTTTPEALWPNG